MFSARAAMLMFAVIFSAGAWAQNTIECTGTNPYKATIHGDTESDVHMDAFVGSKLNEIECERVFKIGVPATIVLPFPTSGMTVTGGNFYQFACVDYDETKGQWVASMTSVDAKHTEGIAKTLAKLKDVNTLKTLLQMELSVVSVTSTDLDKIYNAATELINKKNA